ncbi:hypothetical protein WDU94_006440 [Cyamophila willieti]
MLIMFSILLFMIVLLEALVVLSGYFLQKDISLMIQTKMNASIPDYKKNPDVTKYWDIMQLDLKCCGVHSKADWASVYTVPDLPHSCCPDIGVQDNCTTASSSEKGCMDALANLLGSYSQTILIAAELWRYLSSSAVCSPAVSRLPFGPSTKLCEVYDSPRVPPPTRPSEPLLALISPARSSDCRARLRVQVRPKRPNGRTDTIPPLRPPSPR